MQNIKHIFFDLDHTLWDFEKNSKLALQQIFKEQKITLKFDDFMNKYIPINFNYWRLYRNNEIDKKELRYRRLKDVFDAFDYEVSDKLINKIAEDYLEYLPNNNSLIEGTLDLLEYLQPKYKLHIITNGFKEVQTKKIKQAKIDTYFEVIVTSESIGFKKPNPKVFEFALQQANAKPEESIMIGDSYEADVMGAINTGLLPIHFNIEQKNNNNAIISVNSLIALKQYL